MRSPDGVIWDVRPPRKLPLATIGAAMAAAIVVLGLLAWIAFQVRPAPVQPMTGEFNIAIADFGEIDPASGAVRASPAGSAASQYVYKGLNTELQARLQTVPLADKIELRHDASTSLIKGNTAEERQAAAAALARKLNAHIVVYGNVTPGQSADDLQVDFYVSPQASRDEFAALLGSQALGGDLLLPADYDGSGTLTNISVSEQLDLRSRSIFWLTVALTQDLLGRSEQALATLQQAELELADWQEGDGKELLYFFQGREHLFLRQLDEAQAAFARAVDINPAYTRAAVALGSVNAFRSNEEEDDAAQLAAGSMLQQAIEAQAAGLAEAEAAGDNFTAALAESRAGAEPGCRVHCGDQRWSDGRRRKNVPASVEQCRPGGRLFRADAGEPPVCPGLAGQGTGAFRADLRTRRAWRPHSGIGGRERSPGRLQPVHCPGRAGAVRQGAA